MRTGTNTFCRRCGRFEPMNGQSCSVRTDCDRPFEGQARCAKCKRMGFIDLGSFRPPCKCWTPRLVAPATVSA